MKEQRAKLSKTKDVLLNHFHAVLAKIKGKQLSKALQRRYCALSLGLFAHAVLWTTLVYVQRFDDAAIEAIIILLSGMALSLLLIIPVYKESRSRRRLIQIRIGRLSLSF